MRKPLRSLCAGLAMAFMATMTLTACRDPGPAEETGRDIDEAVEEARDTLDEMGDHAEETLDDIEERVD